MNISVATHWLVAQATLRVLNSCTHPAVRRMLYDEYQRRSAMGSSNVTVQQYDAMVHQVALSKAARKLPPCMSDVLVAEELAIETYRQKQRIAGAL